MKVSIKQVVTYVTHSVKQNGVVKLTLKAMYDQAAHSMELLQLLKEPVTVDVKQVGSDAMRLGVFLIDSVSFSKDGVSTIKFASMNDTVEMGVLNSMVSMEPMRMRYVGEVDVEEKP